MLGSRFISHHVLKIVIFLIFSRSRKLILRLPYFSVLMYENLLKGGASLHRGVFAQIIRFKKTGRQHF